MRFTHILSTPSAKLIYHVETHSLSDLSSLSHPFEKQAIPGFVDGSRGRCEEMDCWELVEWRR